MEEIKEYIESGVLELYVMGDLTKGEMHDVETIAVKYPEVKTELIQIQNALEGYADVYSVTPAENLREIIINNMLNGPAEEINSAVVNHHDNAESKVVSITAYKPTSFYKYAFAASVALLAVSIAALATLYNQLQDSNQRIAVLQSSNQTITSRVNYMTTELAETQEALNVFHNPDVKLIKLAGQKNAPNASMMVAFNAKKAEVMIDMKAVNMPANDEAHQYQLWALVDGKPVDLGVFDASSELAFMKKMKDIGAAQAFAVTLEPRGGSVNPTMEQMMVMGTI